MKQNDSSHRFPYVWVLGVAFLQNTKEKAHSTVLSHAYNISCLLCCSIKTEFPLEPCGLILSPPRCGWVVQLHWMMSQGLAVKCSVCCQVLQRGKEEILFRGSSRSYPIWCLVWYLRGYGTATKWKCKTWHVRFYLDTFTRLDTAQTRINPETKAFSHDKVLL